MKKLFTFIAAALFTITAGAANGDVTNGWLTAEDFEGYNIGDKLGVYAIKYDPVGTADVAESPTDAGQKAARLTSERDATIIEVPITLPDGKTLKDYEKISFDLYMCDGVNRNTRMYVRADGVTIYEEYEGYPNQGNLNVWNGKEYDIPTDIAASNSFKLQLGISTSKGNVYYIDNIRFKEKGYTAPSTSHNGEIIDGWLMLEDFEDAPAVTTFNYVGDTPTGTATVIDNTTSTGGKVASFVGGDYNTVIELSVKLPEGEVLKNYSQIAFDLYRNSGDANNKRMLVQADDYRIFMEESGYPEQAPAETWAEKSYNIDLTNTVGNEFKLRIGILSDNADYLIDNVRLKVINEEDMPGTSQNGTVTDGWLMAEDFEGYLMGAKLTVYPIQYDAKGNADIAKAPTDDRGRSAHFMSTDWNNIIEVPITLPAGKVLANYSEISFDLYISEGSSADRAIYIYANDETILAQEGNPNQGNTGQWLSKSFDIPGGLAAGNEFNLRIGMSVNAGEEYYIDNIRLKESSEPVEPGTSQNGEIVDGWLMLQDFEAATEDDIAAWDKSGYGIPEETTVEIINNPTAGNEKVAWFAGGNTYNTMLEVNAILPSDKTLADYTEIAFDLYRNAEEENDYPGLYIKVNDTPIYDDGESGNDYGPETTWTEIAKPLTGIDGLKDIKGEIKIRLGLLSGKPSYLIDNIRLKPSIETGITDVAAESTTIVANDGSITINTDAPVNAAIFDITGKLAAKGTVNVSKTVSLPQGLYIIKLGSKTCKVLVR